LRDLDLGFLVIERHDIRCRDDVRCHHHCAARATERRSSRRSPGSGPAPTERDRLES
jgi:hypothetical protein